MGRPSSCTLSVVQSCGAPNLWQHLGRPVVTNTPVRISLWPAGQPFCLLKFPFHPGSDGGYGTLVPHQGISPSLTPPHGQADEVYGRQAHRPGCEPGECAHHL
jgi:hypothetical protein